jgi:hypothetical protein
MIVTIVGSVAVSTYAVYASRAAQLELSVGEVRRRSRIWRRRLYTSLMPVDINTILRTLDPRALEPSTLSLGSEMLCQVTYCVKAWKNAEFK